MKKSIAILLLAIATMTAGLTTEAKNRKIDTGAVVSLVSEYRCTEGFDVVSVGSLGLGLARAISNAAVKTEEEKAALSLIDKLHRVVVVNYEDACQKQKDGFTTKLSRLLDGAEKIIEVKDEGDTVNIYGTSSSGGESIEDIIMFIPEDCTLVCLFGSISADSVAYLVNMNI